MYTKFITAALIWLEFKICLVENCYALAYFYLLYRIRTLVSKNTKTLAIKPGTYSLLILLTDTLLIQDNRENNQLSSKEVP